MKTTFIVTALFTIVNGSSALSVQSNIAQVKNFKPSHQKQTAKNLYIDVHHFGPGKVKYEDVAKAHAKDLATQSKFGVNFIRFWVDEERGNVYCLAQAPNKQSIKKTHAKAHGLMPDDIYLVKSGSEAALKTGENFYLDVHKLGAGKVTAEAVAGAHQKDLATEPKYGVNFVNYWVSEKEGLVFCLSQAPDSTSVINTHKEAHGLLPAYVERIRQGQ